MGLHHPAGVRAQSHPCYGVGYRLYQPYQGSRHKQFKVTSVLPSFSPHPPPSSLILLPSPSSPYPPPLTLLHLTLSPHPPHLTTLILPLPSSSPSTAHLSPCLVYYLLHSPVSFLCPIPVSRSPPIPVSRSPPIHSHSLLQTKEKGSSELLWDGGHPFF